MTFRIRSLVQSGGAFFVVGGMLTLSAVSGSAQQLVSANTKGDAENQAGIATALVLGPGKNLQDARRWFEKAAVKGYAPAQVNLAVFYLNGWGTAQNYGSALYWLKAASNQGQPRAYTNLGILYLNGWGVTRNYGEALKNFRYAAEHGETGAMVDVRYMAENGLGTPRNQEPPVEWYRRAAERSGNGVCPLKLREIDMLGLWT